jgi:hypothetical protein
MSPGDEPYSRVQGPAGPSQQLGEPGQIEAVVRLATVEGAPVHPYQPGLAELAQVVGDQALGLAHQGSQLSNPTVAVRQLPQQSPPQGMPGETQDRRRALDLADGDHMPSIDQTRLIESTERHRTMVGVPR